jgi:hypothetical protein
MGTTPQYLERYRWLHHEAQHPRNANASGRPPQIFGHHPGFPEFHRGSRSCATARRAGLDSPPGGGRPTAPRCAGLALTVVIALPGWPESGGTSTTARTAGVLASAVARPADGADRLPNPSSFGGVYSGRHFRRPLVQRDGPRLPASAPRCRSERRSVRRSRSASLPPEVRFPRVVGRTSSAASAWVSRRADSSPAGATRRGTRPRRRCRCMAS